jgi:hypothetical protein
MSIASVGKVQCFMNQLLYITNGKCATENKDPS